MFGFSIAKLLFTAFAVVLVWQGYRWWQRAEQRRIERAERDMVRRGRAGAPVEDMRRCPACGDYVPVKAARACGRRECPYPG